MRCAWMGHPLQVRAVEFRHLCRAGRCRMRVRVLLVTVACAVIWCGARAQGPANKKDAAQG